MDSQDISSLNFGNAQYNVEDKFGGIVFETIIGLRATATDPLNNTIPGDISSTALININGQVLETINFAGDQDWFQVVLSAGQAYDISLLGTGGNPLSDPLVRIMNSSGVELARNDDISLGTVTNSLLTFTVNSTDTYFISAQAFSSQTGNYTLSLTENNEAGGDLAANLSTTGVAIIDGSVAGSFATTNDVDWYAITLTAGSRYVFTLDDRSAGLSVDPFLSLLNAGGALIQSDDNSGPGDGASIAFTSTITDTYYLAVETGGTAGLYGLTTQETPNLNERTIDEIAHFLTDEFAARQTYNLTTINFNFDALSTNAQTLALLALNAWAEITPLNFVETNLASAHIIFTDDRVTPTAENPTGASATGSNVVSNGVIQSSLINISDNWNNGDLSLDSYTYQSFLHEVGHALGLGHAGPYNNTAIYNVDNIYLNDSWAFTVMSYFDQNESGYFGDLRFALGPQIADMVAIQDLYGANTTTRNTDTVYGFNSTETDVHDFSQFSRAPSLSIIDSGGNDTLDFSGYSQVQRIDLNAETFSDINGLDGVISIARGTIIENAIGGSGADLILGNSVDNELAGGFGNDRIEAGAGNDLLIGGAGNDILIGGAGIDTSSYSEDTLGIIASASNVTGTGIGSDNIFQIENIIGGSGDDVIAGGNVNNRLEGGAGNDILTGNGGSDILIGGSGLDTASYADDTFGITATASSVTGAGVGSDNIFQIENIVGGSGNDNISGGNVNNRLDGGAGNDTLRGNGGSDTLIGGTGNDGLVGGAGSDWASYADDTAGITTTASSATGAGIGSDNLFQIENIIGGSGNDDINGGNVGNTLVGNAGNDTIRGNGGSDTLIGGAGNDGLVGGTGSDTADYSASTSNLTITANSASGADIGSDNLFQIENIIGGSGNDNISGGNVGNELEGGAGNDTLQGNGGVDILRGGDGTDTLIGGVGPDKLFGGADADTFVFTTGNGADRVRDWEDGLDVLDLTDFGFADFAALLAVTTKSGPSIFIDLGGGDSILIEHFALADFDASDVLI